MATYRHHKHPDRIYTVVGDGTVSAVTARAINDMDLVTVYTYGHGHLFVCHPGDCQFRGCLPAKWCVISDTAHAQAREPLKIGDNVIVYKGQDGEHWVRRFSEFSDGRFTKVGD